MRKIVVITGTRAEYGLLRPIMAKIKASPTCQLGIIAAGMHLAPEFGCTINDIINDGFSVDATVDMLFSNDRNSAMAKGLGIGVYGIAQALEQIRPDIVLVLGDRVEAFAGAIAGNLSNIVVAHIHGGDISRGGLDEAMRHAITKLAHIHFAATAKSQERIIRMGERADLVFCVGAPGLDEVLNRPLYNKDQLQEILAVDMSSPVLLVVQHPVSTNPEEAANQIRETLKAIQQLELNTILVYPNADAGGRAMIEAIKEYEQLPFLKTFKSLGRDVYLSLLANVSVLIGNSSSGIIEAPSFKLPVVNIGTRQAERERSKNILDVDHEHTAIIEAINRALYDDVFRKQVANCSNPYGDGKASERIVKILADIPLGKELLQKQLAY